MKILGLDLSYSNTGFCVYDTETDKVDVFSKPFPPTLGVNRLLQIHKYIKEVLVNYDIKIVIQQNYSFGSKFNRQAMGQLGGIAKYTHSTLSIPYILTPPTVLKKFVCGKGVADKDRMRLQVYKKWNVDFKSNDQVDAFALAMIGKQFINFHINNETKYTVVITDILKSIDSENYINIGKLLGISVEIDKKKKDKKKCTKTD